MESIPTGGYNYFSLPDPITNYVLAIFFGKLSDLGDKSSGSKPGERQYPEAISRSCFRRYISQKERGFGAGIVTGTKKTVANACA
jgi:hypothetical protein